MAETATVEQVNGTGAENSQETRTFTQNELDEIVKTRVSKERAKYADYEELKTKASKFDEFEEAKKTELQKANEKLEQLQRQLDEKNKADEVRNIREKISKETGVPANLLTGDTEDICKTQAEGILAFAKPDSNYPTVKDGGEVQSSHHKNAADQFAEWFASQNI